MPAAAAIGREDENAPFPSGHASVGAGVVRAGSDRIAQSGTRGGGRTADRVRCLWSAAGRVPPRHVDPAGEPIRAMIGMVCGFGIDLYLWLGTSVPWTWWVMIGTSATFAVGWICSLILASGSKL